MKYVSLFAGIGGFDLALQEFGWWCVFANEWDKESAQTYERNLGHKPDTRDITTIPSNDIPDHDLLVGGFPCQAFSVSGHRRGFEDTRGTLFFEVARILRDKRPRNFILENVKGLLSHERGETFQTILRVLSDIGYECQWSILDSQKFGVPQHRERIYIVGHLRGDQRPSVFPIRPTGAWEDKEPISKLSRAGINPLFTVSDTESTRRARISTGRLRWLTHKELARLQGFPDNCFKGKSLARAKYEAGNAVTVNVAYEVVSKL